MDSRQNWELANTITSLLRQKSLLCVLFTTNTQTQEGKQVRLQLFYDPETALMFLRGFRKELYNHKNRDWSINFTLEI